jgi:hypothetical protein
MILLLNVKKKKKFVTQLGLVYKSMRADDQLNRPGPMA